MLLFFRLNLRIRDSGWCATLRGRGCLAYVCVDMLVGHFFFLLSLFPPLKSYFLLGFTSWKYSPQLLDRLSGPWKDIQTNTLFLVYSFLYMLRGHNYCKIYLIENSILTLGWPIWCQSLCCDLFLTTHTSNTSFIPFLSARALWTSIGFELSPRALGYSRPAQ